MGHFFCVSSPVCTPSWNKSYFFRLFPTSYSCFYLFRFFFFKQVKSILKYLYPVPKDDSKRVVTFANQDDYISFRLVDQAYFFQMTWSSSNVVFCRYLSRLPPLHSIDVNLTRWLPLRTLLSSSFKTFYHLSHSLQILSSKTIQRRPLAGIISLSE